MHKRTHAIAHNHSKLMSASPGGVSVGVADGPSSPSAASAGGGVSAATSSSRAAFSVFILERDALLFRLLSFHYDVHMLTLCDGEVALRQFLFKELIGVEVPAQSPLALTLAIAGDRTLALALPSVQDRDLLAACAQQVVDNNKRGTPLPTSATRLPVHSGELEMQVGSGKWERRVIVIYSGWLHVFRAPDADKPMFVLNVLHASVVKEGAVTLRIGTLQRDGSISLRFADAQVCTEWLSKLLSGGMGVPSNSQLAELRALERKLKRRDEEMAAMRTAQEQLKQESAAANSFRAECKSLQSKVSSLNEQIRALQAVKEQAVASDSYRAENLALNNKLRRITAELQELREKASLAESYRAENVALHRRLTVTRARTASQAEGVDADEASAAAAAVAAVATATTAAAVAAASASPASTPTAPVAAVTESAAGDNAAAQQALAIANQEVAKLRQLVRALTIELDAKSKQIEQLRAGPPAESAPAAATTVAPPAGAGADAGAAAEALKKRAAELERQLADAQAGAQSRVSSVSKERDEAAARVAALTQERDAALARVSELESMLQSSNTEGSSQRATLEKQLNEMRARLATVENERIAATKELEAVRAREQRALEALEQRKTEHAQQAAALEEQLSSARHELSMLRSQSARFAALRKAAPAVVDRLRALRAAAVPLRAGRGEFAEMATSLGELSKAVLAVAQSAQRDIAFSDERYKGEAARRRKLQAQLVAAGGNIRVYCRVRPQARSEADEPTVCVPMSDVELAVDLEAGHRKPFEFDRVFGPESRQEDLYAECEPLVQCALDGYNVCIFAYGQTGAGKTYTMMGPADDPGVTPRALRSLFNTIAASNGRVSYQVFVSVMEIYNENVRDLLRPEDEEATLKHEVKQTPTGTIVTGLLERTASTYEDVLAVMSVGQGNRSVAATHMNSDSSRSHSIVSIKLIGEDQVTKAQLVGKLLLIDLAGSERVKKSGVAGKQLDEARNINSSLSALGNTIQALASKAAHVPYRDSKLTYLLQDSLGGNSKTLMVVQVAPNHSNSSETAASLQFASRVRKVDLGPAKKSTDRDAELERLRQQVKLLQAGSPVAAAAK